MKKRPEKQMAVASAQTTIRAGEGVPIAVQRAVEVTAKGLTAVRFSLSLQAAPVPARRYSSDACNCVADGVGVTLIFAQRKIGVGDPEMRSMLVIKMPSKSACRLLRDLKGFRDPSLEEIQSREGIQKVPTFEFQYEPAQTVALTANMAVGAFAGAEAAMDFYHASPFALDALRKSDQLAVEPVVRVDMSTAVALGLVDRLSAVTEKLPEAMQQILEGL